MNRTTSRADRWAPRALAFAVIALVGSLIGLSAGGASAATPTVAGAGWVRLAHLSPDTKAVDITVTSVSGGVKPFTLQDVAYGTVSDYTALPQGTYVVAMRPAGSSSTAAAMLQTSIDIVDRKAATVAAYGPNASLQTKVFQDDLTAPASGDARIRLIQASTTAATVDVATSTGTVIAKDAAAGSATGYASVRAGTWTLDLTAGADRQTAKVSLAKGSVSTIFVLDDAQGALAVKTVEDSAAAAETPVGGVNTGGGYLATVPQFFTP